MRLRSRSLLCFLLAAICILVPLTAQAATELQTTVYIAEHTLNAYKSPDSGSRVLGVMSYGESMRMLSFEDGWACIQNDKGEIGYCHIGGLTTRNPNTASATLYLSYNAPVYAKPDASSKKLGTMTSGDPLRVVAETPDGEWYRVYNGTRYGYIDTDALSASPFAHILFNSFGG